MIEIKGVDPKMIANNLEPYEPVHPGELLSDELECRKMSPNDLAALIGVRTADVDAVVQCKKPIDSKLALMIEAAIDLPAYILSGMQHDYDMLTAKRSSTLRAKIDNIRKAAAML